MTSVRTRSSPAAGPGTRLAEGGATHLLSRIHHEQGNLGLSTYVARVLGVGDGGGWAVPTNIVQVDLNDAAGITSTV